MYVELDAEKIGAWRYWEGVNAEQAAVRAGVSVSTWLRAENGRGDANRTHRPEGGDGYE